MPREIRPADCLRGQVAIERTSFSAGNLKGQVATEFLMYTAVFMLVAVAAFVVVGDLQRAEVSLHQNTVARETGEGFVSVLTLAVKAGEGFSYNYPFPKTIFGRAYRLDMGLLESPNPSVIIEWEGDYGEFSYQYGLPAYRYKVEGSCLSGRALDSSLCTNMLTITNDGENLTITQLP